MLHAKIMTPNMDRFDVNRDRCLDAKDHDGLEPEPDNQDESCLIKVGLTLQLTFTVDRPVVTGELDSKGNPLDNKRGNLWWIVCHQARLVICADDFWMYKRGFLKLQS